MSRVLFVSNGHGEGAIADRIAAELRVQTPSLEIDHLALVGDVRSRFARDVGPRRSMPSGGLIAMGNVTNIVRDLRAGLARLTMSQWQFLRRARGHYAVVVAAGDAFALWMALLTSAPAIYVGTAKSLHVAPYGPGEERLLRRARAIFVRDEPTAASLRAHGLCAEAPGNVIVDLFTDDREPAFAAATADFETIIALLPGSRAHVYDDAAFLVDVVAGIARERSTLGAVLSIAPGVDAVRMAAALRPRRIVRETQHPFVPFEILEGERPIIRAWSGGIGAMLLRAALVLGQAGTANEAAAAAGLPIIAFDRGVDRERAWYRRRQAGLLGGALIMLRDDSVRAMAEVSALLDDSHRRAALGQIGRERMGPPGGSSVIAQRITAIASESA